MNKFQEGHSKQKISNSCPYGNLYIYYLAGRLKSENEILQENFIGNWEEDNFSFLFFSRPADTVVNDLVSTQSQLTLIDSYSMSYEQWQGAIVTAYEKGCFRIVPPWEAGSDGQHDKISISLDPGIVFGTGTHPTTWDCLEAIELAFLEEVPKTVLDLGTGTGLLALATAHLGCKQNLALDLNLLAAKTAKKNIQLNHMENRVTVVQGKAQDFINRPADLLIANIHYDVMKELIKAESFHSKKKFILSGLLRGEAKHVSFELERLPVKILKHWMNEGIWHTFYGKIEN